MFSEFNFKKRSDSGRADFCDKLNKFTYFYNTLDRGYAVRFGSRPGLQTLPVLIFHL